MAPEPEGIGIRSQGSLHCALMASFCPLGDETQAGWVMKAAQGASRTPTPSSAKFYSMKCIRGMKTNQTDTAKLICSCICPLTFIHPVYLYLFSIYLWPMPHVHLFPCLPQSTQSIPNPRSPQCTTYSILIHHLPTLI